jgi:hypothetical protein
MLPLNPALDWVSIGFKSDPYDIKLYSIQEICTIVIKTLYAKAESINAASFRKPLWSITV